MAEFYSKEAVVEFIRSYRHSTDVAFHMEEHLYEIPAADVVERKKGKWIGGELGHCSCCGNEGCFSDIWPDGQERYCPNCGADIRGRKADV